MNLAEAKRVLGGCLREGLSDHTFGDTERGWWLDGVQVAEGYFSPQHSYVTFVETGVTFTGDDAQSLKLCGQTPVLAR